MAHFAYEALDGGGKMVKGAIEAANEDIIAEKLRDMGFYPLKIAETKAQAGGMDLTALPIIKQFTHRISFKSVMHFTRQLATLIDAGLPILRSLHVLQDQVESVIFKDKIAQMSHDIESGCTLSEALGKHPKQFDLLYVNMVRAGEIGGVLESVLAKVAEFLERRAALVSKIRSAMVYPIVVLLFATVLVSGILIFIMPKFVAIFTEMGAEIPWLTAQLINLSNMLIHQWYVPLGCIGPPFSFSSMSTAAAMVGS
jgi:type IV pilus assembly protein PilC